MFAHGEEQIGDHRVGCHRFELVGALDHAQRQIADPFQLGEDPQHRHDEPQVRCHRVLASQQVVAPLGQRHVHVVDVVVGVDRQRHDTGVVVRQHLAHPLEVLIDANAHHLHLHAQLVELGLECLSQGLTRLQPKRPVT